MKEFICIQCGQKFYGRKDKDRKYCSKKCMGVGKRKTKIVECKICDKKIKVSFHESLVRKYCSKKCAIISLKKKKIRIRCLKCDVWFEVEPWRRDAKFCSMECLLEVRKKENKKFCGEKASNWKGGRHKNGNYWMVSIFQLNKKDKILAKKMIKKGGRRIAEHRLLIAKKIGRPLKSSEIVHHKNGDTDDNRLENLELLTRADHNRVHLRERYSN